MPKTFSQFSAEVLKRTLTDPLFLLLVFVVLGFWIWIAR
jgi:hypothetical protein